LIEKDLGELVNLFALKSLIEKDLGDL